MVDTERRWFTKIAVAIVAILTLIVLFSIAGTQPAEANVRYCGHGTATHMHWLPAPYSWTDYYRTYSNGSYHYHIVDYNMVGLEGNGFYGTQWKRC